MKFLALILWVLAGPCAFSQVPLAVGGTVVEFATDRPLSAANVTLLEDGDTARVIAQSVTDNQGHFEFHPPRPGHYTLSASKPGYSPINESTGYGPTRRFWFSTFPVDLTNESLRGFQLALMHPGGLTGRVLDDRDNPVAGFTVNVDGLNTETDRDGVFRLEGLSPTPRIVRAGSDDDEPALLEYTSNDEGFVTTYWPGGATDLAKATPIEIVPVAVSNLGTIRLRRTHFYRARVTYRGECGTQQVWMLKFDEARTLNMVLDCRREFVLTRLLPGSHTLALYTGTADHEMERWALVPFTITREDVEVSFDFTDAVDVPVRILSSDGKPLNLRNTQVFLDAVLSIPRKRKANPKAGDSFWGNAPSGAFTIESVAWSRHEVHVNLDPGFAVKEIRYNGQSVAGGTITVVPRAVLEILLEDQPASLSGTTLPKATVLVAKWPWTGIEGEPHLQERWSDEEGHFRVDALPAGDYRAVVTRGAVDSGQLQRMLANASGFSLRRGEQRTIELKLSDAPR